MASRGIKKSYSMKLINKTNLCVMSMELIFVLVFIKSIDVPFYIGLDCEFIGWANLILSLMQTRNIIAMFCVVGFIWSKVVYFRLRHKIKGAPTTLPVKIKKIENKDVEYLSLLFTILTIVSFDFGNRRDIIVFLVVFTLYCVLLSSTDWYATNPMLRWRKIHLYSGKTENLPEGALFLSLEEIPSEQEITRPYQKISQTVYWLYTQTNKN